ncbi:MAG: tagaturonate reductase [Bacteroidota bacterium]
MILSKANLSHIKTGDIQLPGAGTFDLPEKVLQFGTGVLLRGLPEYFIDKANKAGVFNGRVVVVKSTAKGSADNFDLQDSLYTIAVRGIENGQKTEENIISSAIIRVINAATAWNDVLRVACSEDLEIVISNTTEAGIELTDDNIHLSPPNSFPGKLLSVLYERYKRFGGDEHRGLIILPTELISDNGKVLKKIVFALAEQNNLEPDFLSWLERANTFCNTLVDRIVPGKPDKEMSTKLEEDLGYSDELLIIAESYKLWAIEGDETVKRALSFAEVDSGVIIVPDIALFKELKLRLLNGSHTLTCGVAILAGYETVNTAMTDALFSEFITNMLQRNLCPGIPYPVDAEQASQFSSNVLDRFRNPFIRHQWISISSNYTLKIKMRVVPILLRYYEIFNLVPEYISFGFAAYLLIMRSEERGANFEGKSPGGIYKIDDENARYYSNLWVSAKSLGELVTTSLSNVQLWGADLSVLPGFAESVKGYLETIQEVGVVEAMKRINSKR